jgi:hypothetical protein
MIDMTRLSQPWVFKRSDTPLNQIGLVTLHDWGYEWRYINDRQGTLRTNIGDFAGVRDFARKALEIERIKEEMAS